MISISRLCCGIAETMDSLRYGGEKHKRPVVVWNMTRRCNLNCIHCYSSSQNVRYSNELTTDEGKKLISDLASFGSPVILFSGGEPMLKEDLPELAEFAADQSVRVVISTNGTLLTRELARTFKKIGVSYIGVSVDGMEKTHDGFRGVKGAFDMTLRGIRICRDEGIKVGMRVTINRKNAADIPTLFELMEREDIPRACFYHLVYSGRGSMLVNEDLSRDEKRRVLDLIMDRTVDLFNRGKPKEILTVDNHADGPYVYMRLLEKDPERAREAISLLAVNEGNSSGTGIGCVSWDGEVHADQFWRGVSFGNVRERPFSTIWMDTSNELMFKLKNKKKYVKGRCADCRWLDICGGNFRARAEAVTGDIWAPDPACYLKEEETAK